MAAKQQADDIELKQHPNVFYALGIAVSLLQDEPVFQGMAFGNTVGMLAGQIRRKHYLFAFNGDKVVGYYGWGWCSEDVALAWAYHGYEPSFDECIGGDTFISQTIVSRAPRVLWRFITELKPMVQGHRAIGKRLKPGQTPQIFNVMIRRSH